MQFYQVLEKRRTVRDLSDQPVSDTTLSRILGAAFKAPTNDHLRQLEFVVIRDRDKIMDVVAPVTSNTKAIQEKGLAAGASTMDKDEHAMFVDALPKQQRMLVQSGCLVLPFFRQKDCPLTKPIDQSSLNYFASAWAAIENILLAATAEGLCCAFRIPIADESEHAKRQVNAPEGYELACFLAVGYPLPDAHLPKQKEIDVESRIHADKFN